MKFSIIQNCPGLSFSRLSFPRLHILSFPIAFPNHQRIASKKLVISRFLIPKTSDLPFSRSPGFSSSFAIVAACIGAKFGVNGTSGEFPKWYAIMVVVFICTYVAGFAWSWGPLGWLVPSEIFPLEIRSAAQSVNVSVNMIFIFIVAQIFLTMLCHLKFGLFIFFAFFVFVMSIFVYYFLPETKGIPIEEMGQVWRSHWYWKRFVSAEEGGGYEMERATQTVKNV